MVLRSWLVIQDLLSSGVVDEFDGRRLAPEGCCCRETKRGLSLQTRH